MSVKVRSSKPPKDKWWSVKDSAQYTQMKPRTLLMKVRAGKLKAYSVSGSQRHVWRFRKEDLDAFILSRPAMSTTTPSKEQTV